MTTPMDAAIETAMEGVQANHGGPFGAAIVKDGKVISVGHNTVIRDSDPTCHAEMNAIRAASRYLGTHVLEGCEIYATTEPCPMCLSAIYWARLEKIVIGSPKELPARYGFDDAFFHEQVALPAGTRAVPEAWLDTESEVQAVFDHWKDLERPVY